MFEGDEHSVSKWLWVGNPRVVQHRKAALNDPTWPGWDRSKPPTRHLIRSQSGTRTQFKEPGPAL